MKLTLIHVALGLQSLFEFDAFYVTRISANQMHGSTLSVHLSFSFLGLLTHVPPLFSPTIHFTPHPPIIPSTVSP